MTVPALTEARAAAELDVVQRTLANGLTVTAVAKPGVPLAEVRLRVPFLAADPSLPAHATLLSDALLTGAGTFDRAGLAAALQALGADLSVGVDADRLMLSGNVLATALPHLLEVLSTVLTAPTFAADEVATERDRLVERLTIARSRPGTIAGEALGLRMWGRHPYALDLPEADEVAATTADQVRAVHEQRVHPGSAGLVIVGDIETGAILDLVETAFAEWIGTAPAVDAPPEAMNPAPAAIAPPR